MPTRPDLAAFVIAYHRDATLPELLARLQAQTVAPATILVVDNGRSDSTAAIAAAAGCDYLRMPRNSGPAGGAAAGLRTLVDRGFTWVAWCDDDDPPRWPDAFEQLLAQADGDDVGVVGGSGLHWDFRTGEPVRLHDEELRPDVVDVDVIRASAQVLVHRRAVAAVGLPHEPFFWGHEDYDFDLRLRAAGLRVLCAAELLRRLRRETGSEGRPPTPTLAARAAPPTARSYYTVRNTVHSMRTQLDRPGTAAAYAVRWLLRALLAVPTSPRTAATSLSLTVRAIIEGWCGRLGRRMPVSS